MFDNCFRALVIMKITSIMVVSVALASPIFGLGGGSILPAINNYIKSQEAKETKAKIAAKKKLIQELKTGGVVANRMREATSNIV